MQYGMVIDVIDKQIRNVFDSKRNLFLTGAAGTGKSTWLNKYIDEHENVLICAPTGIAALNIGGDTMHRIFHIPVPAYDTPSFAKGKKGAITQSVLNVIANADTIIMDEISMARNDVFRFAIKVIRKAEKIKGSKIRIIVSGDFSQLPPVVKKNETSFLKKFGLDASGYAFTTQEWKSCNFKVVELTDVKRQEDREFIEKLNEIRVGNFTNLDYWKQFVNEKPDYENSVVICGTNAEADRINQEYLEKLPGDLKVLQSQKQGYGTAGYVDDIILVKEGCKIIFTANDTSYVNGKPRYQNGTFGTVKYVGSEYVAVHVNGETISVAPHVFSIYSYNCKGNVLTKKEIGSVTQFPFKVGKAITIHKSQGQTFDDVIISPEIFASGQLYVALSRVRSPKGLVLLSELKPEYLIIHEHVKKFYENSYTWDVKKVVKKKPVVKQRTMKKRTTKKSTATKSAKPKTVKRKPSVKKTVSRKTATKKSVAKARTSKRTVKKK